MSPRCWRGSGSPSPTRCSSGSATCGGCGGARPGCWPSSRCTRPSPSTSSAPSRRACGHWPTRGRRPRAEPGGILVVAAGGRSLPAVEAELTLLRQRYGDRVVTGDAARIGDFPQVHVAGHAIADLTNPSRGGIARYDRAPFTVGELSRVRRPGGRLAFLSACETARTSPELADETVHIASVLHVAGFQHVVATLWTVPDRVALRAAKLFYADDGDVPGAVHRMVLALRARYPDDPLAWAAYVHIGP
ncbi:CHAT domain-containing protein [Dactylosporangium sp. CS-047395]|uniref:CHAT domain-containing protein n=1 Tax=Dactylosporangium sp. CS-047395 TaxID=3239936 RepID=UPI003D8D457A